MLLLTVKVHGEIVDANAGCNLLRFEQINLCCRFNFNLYTKSLLNLKKISPKVVAIGLVSCCLCSACRNLILECARVEIPRKAR